MFYNKLRKWISAQPLPTELTNNLREWFSFKSHVGLRLWLSEGVFSVHTVHISLVTVWGSVQCSHCSYLSCHSVRECSVFTLFISLLSQSAAVGEAERLAGTDGEPQLRPPVLLWLEREDSQHSTGGYHETAGPASTHQTTPSHPPRSLSDLITVMTAASAAYIKRFRAAWNRG